MIKLNNEIFIRFHFHRFENEKKSFFFFHLNTNSFLSQIGTGQLDLDPTFICQTMIDAALEQLTQYQLDVFFVIYQSNECFQVKQRSFSQRCHSTFLHRFFGCFWKVWPIDQKFNEKQRKRFVPSRKCVQVRQDFLFFSFSSSNNRWDFVNIGFRKTSLYNIGWEISNRWSASKINQRVGKSLRRTKIRFEFDRSTIFNWRSLFLKETNLRFQSILFRSTNWSQNVWNTSWILTLIWSKNNSDWKAIRNPLNNVFFIWRILPKFINMIFSLINNQSF